MKFHAPKDVYGPNLLSLFVRELGGVKAVYKHLGVSERTVYHWLSSGHVPRTAVLALFWETQWGRGHIYADQVNEIRLLYAQLNLLQRQYRRATQIISGLRALHTGSANEPLFEELPDWPLQRSPSFGTTEEAEHFAVRVREAIRMTEDADTRAVAAAR